MSKWSEDPASEAAGLPMSLVGICDVCGVKHWANPEFVMNFKLAATPESICAHGGHRQGMNKTEEESQ